jgi:hypothetical protein
MEALTNSHRQAVWLTVGLLLAFVVGAAGYELNWIAQRRAAWAALHEWLIDKDFIRDQQRWISQELPARGVGRLDEFVMRLSGERKSEWFYAHDEEHRPDIIGKYQDTMIPDDILESLAVVRRARWLFPEAEIDVKYEVQPEAADR